MSPSESDLLAELPPLGVRTVSSLACAYGADYVTAAYCGFPAPPYPPPGIWQHGWIAQPRNIDPAAIIGGYGSYEASKGIQPFWVARKDQEDYLRERGYVHAKAIGMPIVYLTPRPVRRAVGTLLVMPVHSLEYTNHAWNFRAYAEAITQLRGRFREIVACVHHSCWKRGYWVDDFRRVGIPVVEGARGDDRNALLRLQYLFSRFEFVTTNGYGSHLPYASYLGAKVSIFGPYAEYRREDYSNTALYQECPQILEPTLDLMREASVRRDYPFLFASPEAALPQREWGAGELGESNRVQPEELRHLFQWTPLGRTLQALTGTGRRWKANARSMARHCVKFTVSRAYRERLQEFKEVRSLPPHAAGETTLYGKPFRFVDASSFLFLYEEIVRRGIYRFSSSRPDPLIIDCGANIGMAVSYFKQLYPQARVVAFEPDPKNFEVLSDNCRRRGLDDVALHQAAVWVHSGALGFQQEASSLGGRLDLSAANAQSQVSVRAVRLRDLLEEKVAMLKIDIEGAETEVLADCADRLQNVDHLFVEYHSFADRKQTLAELLNVIDRAGFRVHIHTYDPSPQPLFLRTVRSGIDLLDMNLDIFCFRA